MKSIFIHCICFLFFCLLPAWTQGQTGSANNSTAQGQIKMTAAEYQSLIETILKAKQKRTQTRYIYYTQPKQIIPPNTTTESFSSNATNTQQKVEELEKIQSQIESQKSNDTVALQELQQQLEREMILLKQQLNRQALASQQYAYKATETSRSTANNPNLQSLIIEQRNHDRHIEELRLEKVRMENEIRNLKNQQGKFLTEIPPSKDHQSEIDDLKQQVRSLEHQQNTLILLGAEKSNNPSDLKATTNNQEELVYLSAISKQLGDMQARLEMVEKKKAPTPKVEMPKATPSIDHSQDLARMQSKIESLEKKLLDQANKPTPAPVIVSPPPVAVTPAAEPRTHYQQQNIYFPNGSADLTIAEKERIQSLANMLRSSSELDITIKGFASNVGSFQTNQVLSQQRAEAVKQALLNLGVQAKRIIMEPLGVDTASNDPANARRAEIHLWKKE